MIFIKINKHDILTLTENTVTCKYVINIKINKLNAILNLTENAVTHSCTNVLYISYFTKRKIYFFKLCETHRRMCKCGNI